MVRIVATLVVRRRPRHGADHATRAPPMITHRCTCCGSVVFFENVRCGACGSPLGFVPAEHRLVAFSVDAVGRWHRLGDTNGAAETSWHPCANYLREAVCNWMVPASDDEALCESCRYTEVIPALADPRNRMYWYRLEVAKRRLLVSLRALGLPVPSRRDDPVNGLAFHFVAGGAALGRVITGHASGLVTMNISEADDVTREHQRTHMGEPYRTLLGHFRHEAGHFYWPRLVGPTRWLQPFRALFGDEQAPYDDALSAHYRRGAPADWAQRHVSAYASCHPWEDWAETWAHYLHIVDAMETAAHWGAAMGIGTGDAGPATRTVFAEPGGDFAALLETRWLPLAQFVNSMNRSLGHADSYPFVLPHPVVEKLAFVDKVVRGGGCGTD
jgi:hypothetical protein